MITGTAAKYAAAWIGAVLLAAGILLAWYFLPAQDWISSVDAWIGRRGPWGIAIFAIAYVGLVILLAPAEVMSIAAGLIFGLWGIPIVIVCATIGAAFAFLVSRHLVRASVKAFTNRREMFKAVDRAVQAEGWKLVVLFRLNPLVPFNMQNYLFGATDIGLLPYVTATFFGIMPGAVAYVYIGRLGQAAAGVSQSGSLKIALLGAGFVATLVIVWLIGARAKAMLKDFGVRDDTRAGTN